MIPDRPSPGEGPGGIAAAGARGGLSRLPLDVQRPCRLLKLLSNEARLQILCLLLEGRQSVMAIRAALSLRQPAVSQHLALLRDEGLVRRQREGKVVFYALNSPDVEQILRLLDRLGGQGEDAAAAAPDRATEQPES